MEPIMSFEGFKVIESTDKSKDLLNTFYQSMGYTITDPNDKIAKKEIKKAVGSDKK